MKYTTAIFDLDGTLLDTLDDLTDAVNAAMRAFGYPVHTRDEVRGFVGNGARLLIERSLGGVPGNFDEIFAFYDEYYTTHSMIKTAPYPGVTEALRALVRSDVKIAVVSNKQDRAVKALVRKFFGDCCSVAVGESKKVRRKPAPDSVIAAMGELFSEKYECVYVGDSEVDIETAKNAGIDCISVTWGFRGRDFLKEKGAATLCDSAEELVKAII